MAENVAFSGHSFMCDLVGFNVIAVSFKVTVSSKSNPSSFKPVQWSDLTLTLL